MMSSHVCVCLPCSPVRGGGERQDVSDERREIAATPAPLQRLPGQHEDEFGGAVYADAGRTHRPHDATGEPVVSV